MSQRSTSASSTQVCVEPTADPRAARIVADGAISVAAFARHCGISRTKAWSMMDNDEIAWIAASPRKRLIPRSEVVRWMSSRLRVGRVNSE